MSGDGDPATRRETAGPWRRGPGAGLLALTAVGALATGVALLIDRPGDGEVVLPEPGTERDGAPAGAADTTPAATSAELRLTCLAVEDCVRWRLEVGPLASAATGGSVAPLDDGGVAVLAPGRVLALDAAGERRWAAEGLSGGGGREDGLATAGDLLLAAAGAEVVAIDAATGQERWRSAAPATGETLLEATVVDGVVVLHVVVTETGGDPPVRGRRLLGLDATDGRVRWERDVAGAAVHRGTLGAVVGDEVAALDPDDGEPRWSVEVAAAAAEPGAVPLTTTAGAVLIEAGGEVVALAAADGRPSARHQGRLVDTLRAGELPPLVVDEDTAGAVTAIEPDGNAGWSRSLELGGDCCARPRLLGGTLALIGAGALPRVSVLDAADGTPLSEGRLPGVGTVVGALGPRVVQVANPDGGAGATAVSVPEGEPRWRVEGGFLLHPLEGVVLVALGEEVVAVDLDAPD